MYSLCRVCSCAERYSHAQILAHNYPDVYLGAYKSTQTYENVCIYEYTTSTQKRIGEPMNKVDISEEE